MVNAGTPATALKAVGKSSKYMSSKWLPVHWMGSMCEDLGGVLSIHFNSWAILPYYCWQKNRNLGTWEGCGDFSGICHFSALLSCLLSGRQTYSFPRRLIGKEVGGGWIALKCSTGAADQSNCPCQRGLLWAIKGLWLCPHPLLGLPPQVNSGTYWSAVAPLSLFQWMSFLGWSCYMKHCMKW